MTVLAGDWLYMQSFFVALGVRNFEILATLIETDCPYLAPAPHRGKRNEPAFVAETARFVAKIRNVELEQLESEVLSNFTRLFSREVQ